jgi:uncharacterized membrane protein (DUF2068 family)
MKKPFRIVMTTVYTASAGVFTVTLPINRLLAAAVVNPTAFARLEFMVSLLVGLVAFIACCGLWTMSSWGLFFGRVYYCASILLSLASVMFLRPQAGFFGLEGLFILSESGILLSLFQLKSSPKRSLINHPAGSLR